MTLRPGPDIREPEAIDARWLTDVLQTGGVDAVVRSFTAKPIGTGQIGDSFRFQLTFEQETPDGPKSLVGKFPASGEASRHAGVTLGNYVREVRFYQQLAPTALIRTPRCFFADVEEQTGAFVLMMEDLAPAEQGDQLEGVTLEQARLVVVEAAKLHASHWQDEAIEDLGWVSGTRAAPSRGAGPGKLQQLWSRFRQRYQARLDDGWLQAGDRLAAGDHPFASTYDGPRCLTHVDFRPDNMMFASPHGGAPVTVLDWQSVTYGVGAADLGYFLAGALPPAVRRAHEPELLRLYHATLQQHGVRDYSLEDLERHYPRGAYALFVTAVFAALLVTPTERGDRMFLQMLESALMHLRDHGALSVSTPPPR